MKKIYYIIFVLIFLTSTVGYGQSDMSDLALTSFNPAKDSLIVERENGHKIILTWPASKNIKKNGEWEQLLTDFQTDFAKVIDGIPDYSFYEIKYLQKKNLVVDEVAAREIYTVNDADDIEYIRSNKSILTGNKIKMTVEFNEANELLKPELKEDISEAISKVKHIFYFSLAPERSYYSVKQKGMIKKKPQLQFFIPFGARIGLLQNKPYIELRPALGVAINKKSYVALNYDLMTRYDQLNGRTQYDNFIGITYGTMGPGVGVEYALKVKEGISDFKVDGTVIRAGLNYRTRSGIQAGIQYYLRAFPDESDFNSGIVWGFNFGIGF